MVLRASVLGTSAMDFSHESWLVEFRRKLDEFDARMDGRWGALEQRGAAVKPRIGGLEQTSTPFLVKADNWGGLFDEIYAPDSTSSNSSSPMVEEHGFDLTPAVICTGIASAGQIHTEVVLEGSPVAAIPSVHLADPALFPELVLDAAPNAACLTPTACLTIRGMELEEFPLQIRAREEEVGEQVLPDLRGNDGENKFEAGQKLSTPDRICNSCADDDGANDPIDPGPWCASQACFRIDSSCVELDDGDPDLEGGFIGSLSIRAGMRSPAAAVAGVPIPTCAVDYKLGRYFGFPDNDFVDEAETCMYMPSSCSTQVLIGNDDNIPPVGSLPCSMNSTEEELSDEAVPPFVSVRDDIIFADVFACFIHPDTKDEFRGISLCGYFGPGSAIVRAVTLLVVDLIPAATYYVPDKLPQLLLSWCSTPGHNHAEQAAADVAGTPLRRARPSRARLRRYCRGYESPHQHVRPGHVLFRRLWINFADDAFGPCTGVRSTPSNYKHDTQGEANTEFGSCFDRYRSSVGAISVLYCWEVALYKYAHLADVQNQMVTVRELDNGTAQFHLGPGVHAGCQEVHGLSASCDTGRGEQQLEHVAPPSAPSCGLLAGQFKGSSI